MWLMCHLRLSVILTVTIIGSSVSGYQVADANPFFIGRFDGLTGGPLVQSPFALYWNPANLYTERPELSLFVGVIARQATYDRVVSNDASADVIEASSGLATTNASGALPSFAFRTGFDLDGLKLGVGTGVYIARGGNADWNRHPDADVKYPGAYDGPQRWGALSTFMLVVNYAAGLSATYQRFSIGAAMSYTNAMLSTTKAANAGGSEDLFNTSGYVQEGRVFLDNATGERLSFTLGTRVDLDDVQIGFAYCMPVVYELDGTANVLYSNSESVTSAQVELQVASSYLSSISYKIDEVTLRVEHEYQGWSLMDNQKIVNDQDVLLVLERNFEDSQAYRFRLDYALDDGVILHGGLSYEDGVTPEEYHGPGLAEHDQVEAGLGLTWPFNDSLSLHSTFFYQHFFDRRVVSSLQKPTTNGDYTDRRQYLTLNLRWKL
jgi:hypothetical protein